jgi:hypothetical protein
VHIVSGARGPAQPSETSSSAAILIVAKLENVSETA